MRAIVPPSQDKRLFITLIFEVHYEALFLYATALCRRYSHPHDLAKDLIMDMFERLLNGQLQIHISHPDDALPYLKRKVSTNLIDQFRKQQSILKSDAKFQQRHATKNSYDLFDLFPEIRFNKLMKEIDQHLPIGRDRTLFKAYLDGYSFKEMEQHFDLKLNTIASRVYRMRRVVKDKLQLEYYEK